MQYIVREISNQWKNAQLYIPHLEVEKCKIYEVIFARLNGKKNVEVSLDIPTSMLYEDLELYFANGRGNLVKVGYKRVDDKLLFATNKVGVYTIIAKENKGSVLSKIVTNASSISKHMGLRIDKAMKGM